MINSQTKPHAAFSTCWARGGGGEKGTPIYKPYRYVPPPPQGVWVLRRFGLKTGIDFAHFGLESGMVFEGATGVYERIYRFNSKWIRKKEIFFDGVLI